MKRQQMMQATSKTSALAGLAIAAVMAAAVVAPNVAEAITVDEVVTLVRLGIPPAQIIKKIEKDGTVYNLKAAQILKLKKAQVPDVLIRHMLQTASKAKSGGGAVAAPVVTKKDEPKRELTAAERAAEEARMKEEALRLAEEQRKREEAQRKAFAGKVLKRGQRAAKSGKWVEAIAIFTKFVNDGVGGIPFAPDSDEAYFATYGIANALARAGLLQSAANKLLEVVRAGPEKIFFRPAFNQLRALRRKINYRPPELEDLTKFAVINKSKAFQDSYNYFVGEFLHDFGLSGEAMPYLEKVGTKSPDYPRAQYLLGLIAFQDEALDTATKVKSASQGFQNAVLSGMEQNNQGMVDLAYLALARMAYEYEQLDAAIYYYRKISKNSPKLARAFYESGWSYFLKNDVSRALGTFHALHSPYFKHHFYPELWILEATIYVQACYPKRAKAAIKRFEEDVLVLGPPLRDFLKRNRRPEDFYGGIVQGVNKPKTSTLPRKLISPVLQNVEFYNLYKTIKQIGREEAKVMKYKAKLGLFGQELLAKLGQLKSERIAEAGVVVQRTLRAVQKDISTYQDRLTELRIDLQEQELEVLDRKIQQVENKGKITEKAVAAEGAIAIAGSDSMVWPFEGEFWKDEIGAYRSFLRTQCTEQSE